MSKNIEIASTCTALNPAAMEVCEEKYVILQKETSVNQEKVLLKNL